MTKKTLLGILAFVQIFLFIQPVLGQHRPVTSTPSSFQIVPALRDRAPELPPDNLTIQDRPDRKKKKVHKNLANALPVNQIDPIRQSEQGTRALRAPIVNFDGLSGQQVLDDNGAVGPNHYVQMINWSMQIFDKAGNSLYGPTALSSVFPGSQNVGDPIVFYDELADRWFISQFQYTGMVIAISQTPDPLGAWYQYSYNQGTLPDYPKIGLWTDGYYMSANTTNNAVIYEREAMLAGDPGARQLMLQLPSYTQGGGFFTPTTVDLEGTNLPPAGTPHYFVTFTDDGWGGSYSDSYFLWELDVDWVNTGNTTITKLAGIPATPFSTDLGATATWQDIVQPNSQKIDGMLDICMFPAHYRFFGTHASLVGCFTVNAGSNVAGMRWFELRNSYDGSGWSVYQEGTYSPDNTSRFNGSVDIDLQGNIGLGYNVSSSSVYPGIRYTGRLSSDPLGQMTFPEGTIKDATVAVNGDNRWADYSAMTIDPTDELTFWYTNQYATGSSTARARIASFKLAPDLPVDLGATAIVAPVSGSMTATQGITVRIKNFGVDAQTVYDVSYVINQGPAVTETVNQNIDPNTTFDYTFTQTADMSAYGTYEIMAYTTIAGDGFSDNDTTTVSVLHNFPEDVGVTSIISPATGMALTASETVSVSIENLGTTDASGFPVSFQIDGGTVVTETVNSTIPALSTGTYTFTATADLSVIGSYTIKAYTSLATDGDNSNDTTVSVVENQVPVYCEPTSNCTEGDGFQLFSLNTINNTSTCGNGGYSDFTNISTTLMQSETYTVSVQQNSGYSQVFALWIDFNDNATFEDSERLIDAFPGGSGSSYSTTFTVPSNATLGIHRLRARAIYESPVTGTPLDACDPYEYGETEDYTVEITLFINAPELVYEGFDFYVITGNNESSAEVVVKGVDEPYTISVMNTLGQELSSKEIKQVDKDNSTLIDISGYRSGNYFIRIKNDKIDRSEKIIIK